MFQKSIIWYPSIKMERQQRGGRGPVTINTTSDKLCSSEAEFLGKSGNETDPCPGCAFALLHPPPPPTSCRLSCCHQSKFCSASLGSSAPQTLSLGFIAFARTKARTGGLPPGSLLLRTLHSHWKQFPEFTGRRRGTVGVEVKPWHAAGAFR